jgi:hypothetical protein
LKTQCIQNQPKYKPLDYSIIKEKSVGLSHLNSFSS